MEPTIPQIRSNDNQVQLLGYYGSDLTHAASAWTSTTREITDEKRERIPSLLKFLAANGHHTPFEKSTLHFLVTCDTASHIHLLKHRVGVSINGESARYKELKEDKLYVPWDWRGTNLEKVYRAYTWLGYKLYHWSLPRLEKAQDRKRAKESARYFLPYGNQVTLDITFNFRSFQHFISLRDKPDAQQEIRTIAHDMYCLVWATGDFNHSLAAFKEEVWEA